MTVPDRHMPPHGGICDLCGEVWKSDSCCYWSSSNPRSPLPEQKSSSSSFIGEQLKGQQQEPGLPQPGLVCAELELPALGAFGRWLDYEALRDAGTHSPREGITDGQ